jgi:hypothetical protein
MAHGVVITASGATWSTMPMMTAGPALSGSALWFLGKPTAVGMHAGTLAFTAVTPGSCQYLFPATPPKACRRVYWQVSARPPPQRPAPLQRYVVSSLSDAGALCGRVLLQTRPQPRSSRAVALRSR